MPSVMRVRTPQESQMEVEDLKRRAEALKYQNQLKAEQLKSIQMDQVVGNTRERNNFARTTPVGQVVPRNQMQGYTPPPIADDEKLYGMIQQQQALDIANENLNIKKQNALIDAENKGREMQMKELDLMSAIEQKNQEIALRQEEIALKQQNMAIARDFLKSKGIVPLDPVEGAAATDVALNNIDGKSTDKTSQGKIMNLLSNDGEYEVVLGGDLLADDGIKLAVKPAKETASKSSITQNKQILDYAEKMGKTEYYAQAKEQGFSEAEIEKPIMTQAEIAKYIPAAKEALGIPLTPQEKEQKITLAKRKEASKILRENGYEPTDGNIEAIIAQMQ